MCFSPVASFITAGLTGAVGLTTMSRTTQLRELPLAATPLFFAVQQGLEGLLWLNLPAAPQSPMSKGLVLFFLVFAQVFWPTFAALAALSIEPMKRRRRLMWPWFAVGLGVSGYLLWGLLTRSHGAQVIEDHIVYTTEQPHSTAVALAYLASVSLPLLLSSRRTLVMLGAVVLVGCAVAYGLYLEAFQSVWCFFAAAASVIILAHFEWIRRWRAPPAVA